jgi:hypothetical protein
MTRCGLSVQGIQFRVWLLWLQCASWCNNIGASRFIPNGPKTCEYSKTSLLLGGKRPWANRTVFICIIVGQKKTGALHCMILFSGESVFVFFHLGLKKYGVEPTWCPPYRVQTLTWRRKPIKSSLGSKISPLLAPAATNLAD